MRHVKKRNLRRVATLAAVGGLIVAGTVISGAFASQSPGARAGSQPEVLDVDVAHCAEERRLDRRIRSIHQHAFHEVFGLAKNLIRLTVVVPRLLQSSFNGEIMRQLVGSFDLADGLDAL